MLYDPEPGFVRAIELAQARQPAATTRVYFLMQQDLALPTCTGLHFSHVHCRTCMQARQPAVTIRVYFLMQQDSVEEQRYKSALRIEREAFQSLILE